MMRKIILGGTAVLILFLTIRIISFFIRPFPDLCSNEVLAVYPSPNNNLKAVIFERDCGATTDFSTQVSIIPTDEKFENEGGNLFSADTNHGRVPSGQGGGPEIKLRWLSDTRLQIQHHPSTRIFHSEPELSGVQIEYSAGL